MPDGGGGGRRLVTAEQMVGDGPLIAGGGGLLRIAGKKRESRAAGKRISGPSGPQWQDSARQWDAVGGGAAVWRWLSIGCWPVAGY